MDAADIRIALVGAGGIGRTHLKAWCSVPAARIVAIADTDADHARAAADEAGAEAYADVDRMLDEVQVDAVDVCTPPSSHPGPVEAALRAGAHVICEKPLAADPVSAQQMVAAADEAGRLLMTAFCHRFHPPIARLRELIESGEFGSVCMFRNRFAGPFAGVEDRWFSDPAISGGGCLMDTSVHSVDLFRFLVGEVVRVGAMTLTVNEELPPGVEDTATVLLAAESGAIGSIEASWALPAGVNAVEVYGTRGVAFVHYWDGLQSRYRLDGMQGFEPLPEEGDRFVGELSHFAAAVRGECPLSVTGFDGQRAVEVIHQAYLSAGLR
jgi:predicted dehydrogenase